MSINLMLLHFLVGQVAVDLTSCPGGGSFLGDCHGWRVHRSTKFRISLTQLSGIDDDTHSHRMTSKSSDIS